MNISAGTSSWGLIPLILISIHKKIWNFSNFFIFMIEIKPQSWFVIKYLGDCIGKIVQVWLKMYTFRIFIHCRHHKCWFCRPSSGFAFQRSLMIIPIISHFFIKILIFQTNWRKMQKHCTSVSLSVSQATCMLRSPWKINTENRYRANMEVEVTGR